jgi:outer membrane lipopolysaccharide assembly protein LptE/RlpB
MKKTVASFVMLVLLAAVTSGCGYRFRASGEPLGINIESLAIPLFSSTSSEIGFEADFTRVIREEFISHARVPLVPEDRADKVIVGKIHDIRTDPLTYEARDFTVSGQVRTYEVTRSRNLRMSLDARLVDRRTGNVIWRDQNMTVSSSFVVDPDPMVTRYNQTLAVEKIARRLAKRIYLKTMERF